MFDEFFNDVFLAKLKHPMYTKKKILLLRFFRAKCGENFRC